MLEMKRSRGVCCAGSNKAMMFRRVAMSPKRLTFPDLINCSAQLQCLLSMAKADGYHGEMFDEVSQTRKRVSGVKGRGVTGWGVGTERRGGPSSYRVATDVNAEANSKAASTPKLGEGLFDSSAAPRRCQRRFNTPRD